MSSDRVTAVVVSSSKMEAMTPEEIEAALNALRDTLALIDERALAATEAERAHIAGSIAALERPRP